MSDKPPVWMRKIVNDVVRRDKIDNAVAKLFGSPQVVVDWDAPPLGCAHYGCVFRLTIPTHVVKITRDPTEGPMQAIIGKRQDKGDYGFEGFAMVKGVFRLDHDVAWRGKSWPVYVIVREEVEPLVSRSFIEWIKKIYPPTNENMAYRAIGALSDYQQWSRNFVEWKTERKKHEADRHMSDALRKISDAFPYLGEIMQIMQGEGTPLLDVHSGNVGIRVHPGVVDPLDPESSLGAVVIFDPGHTPSGEEGEEAKKSIATLNPFDPEELRMGTKVEMEHTDDPKFARQIVLDHLREHPNYYSKLKKIGLNPPKRVVPPGMTIKKDKDFSFNGEYHLTYAGHKASIYRDPENGYWYVAGKEFFTERAIGFTMNEALEKMAERMLP